MKLVVHPLVQASLLLSFWVGCSASNNGGVGSFQSGESGGVTEYSSAIFSGASSVDVVAGTAIKIYWPSHAEAVLYLVYDVTNGTPIYKGSAGSGSTQLMITGLTPNTSYRMRVRLLDAKGLQDANTNDLAFTTGPDACYQQVVLADHPVIYFPMNEVSGTDATDLGSAGLNPSYAGSFSLGQVSGILTETSYAVDFDGSSAHIDLGNAPQLQITGDQTIEMWIKPASFNARRNPYAKAYGGEGTITLETSRQLNYYYGTAGGNSGPYQGFNSSGTVSATGWTHIAVVRDLTNMKLYWYINGVQTNTANASYAAAATSSLSAMIGKGYVSQFDGLIEDVAVYSTALSATRIQAHYDAASTCP